MIRKITLLLIISLLCVMCACGSRDTVPSETDNPSAATPTDSEPSPSAEPDAVCGITVYLPMRSDVSVVSGGVTYYPQGDSNYEYIFIPAKEGSKVVLEASDGLIYTFRSWTGEISSTDRTVEITARKGLYLTMNLDMHYGENIALGAAVTCMDSEENGTTYTAANLTDGSYSTAFYMTDGSASGDSRLMAVTVDLGEIYEISLISLAPLRNDEGTDNYPTFLAFRVSTDGAAYTEIGAYNNTKPSGGHLTHYSFKTVRARYIRILAMPAEGSVGLSEVEVR